MRDHQARRLEVRFRPLFLLASLDRLWPVKTEDQQAAVWRAARELRAATDEAGFSTRHLAEEKDLGVNWGQFLWKLEPDTTSAGSKAGRIAWTIGQVSDWLRAAFPPLRRASNPAAGVGLLEALSKDAPGLREHLRGYMRSRPISAHIVFEQSEARLVPDPGDLRDVAWILAAELIEGGWPIRRCAAPRCDRYIGQWTQRERLFCNETCRTAYHNAQRQPAKRRPRGRPRKTIQNVPVNVPAPVLDRPHSSPRQPRAKKKTPR